MYKGIEFFLQVAVKNLDDSVVNHAERTVIITVKTGEVNLSTAVIEVAVCSALNNLLLSNLKNKFLIRKSFKLAMLQVASSAKAMPNVCRAIVTDAAVLALIAIIAVEAVRVEVV